MFQNKAIHNIKEIFHKKETKTLSLNEIKNVALYKSELSNLPPVGIKAGTLAPHTVVTFARGQEVTGGCVKSLTILMALFRPCDEERSCIHGTDCADDVVLSTYWSSFKCSLLCKSRMFWGQELSVCMWCWVWPAGRNMWTKTHVNTPQLRLKPSSRPKHVSHRLVFAHGTAQRPFPLSFSRRAEYKTDTFFKKTHFALSGSFYGWGSHVYTSHRFVAPVNNISSFFVVPFWLSDPREANDSYPSAIFPLWLAQVFVCRHPSVKSHEYGLTLRPSDHFLCTSQSHLSC